MRAHEKKKAFKKMCRTKVLVEGMINQPDGTWRPYSQTKDDSMRRDMVAGYGAPDR